jgi:hypothetical protein
VLWIKMREEAEGQPSNTSDWAGGDITFQEQISGENDKPSMGLIEHVL